jgi:uncharacterized protein DUF6152
MRIKLTACIAAAAVLFAVVPALAHHSFSAEFDANVPIHLEGTVAKMEWVNPHAWIYVDVKKPDGTVEQWKIEGGTPNALFRRGFTKESLKTGTAIIVNGYRAKDGTLKGNGRDLTLPDGRKLFLSNVGEGPGADPK